MIPQLPNESKIRFAEIPGGYEFTREAPIGGPHGHLFLAGFLFLWLIGWTFGGTNVAKDLADPEVPWFAKAFSAFWIVGWTICGGLIALFFIGILRKPRPVRLAIEPSRLVWTPPYSRVTRLPRLRFWMQEDGRVAKDGIVTLLLTDVSSVTLHEATSVDDSLMLFIECGSRRYGFEWFNENDAELRWLHTLIESWKNARLWSD